MRTVFYPVASRSTARRKATWAAVIVNVCGGFMAFESTTDWQTWRAQK